MLLADAVWPNDGKVLILVGYEDAGRASTQNRIFRAPELAAKYMIAYRFACAARHHAMFREATRAHSGARRKDG
jgi:hypothetical protein